MNKRIARLLIVPAVLGLAVLACDKATTAYELEHPTEAVQTLDASVEQPVIIKMTGTRTQPDPQDNQAGKACSASTDLTLILYSYGDARLFSTGMGFRDYSTCAQSDLNESWYIYGTADFATGTITWETCNNDDFLAVGETVFDDTSFSGTVECYLRRTMEKRVTISR